MKAARETETGIKTDPTVKYSAEKTDETGDNNISNSQQHSKNLSHKRSKMESPVLPGLKPENSEECPRNQAKNKAEKVVSNKLNAGQFILPKTDGGSEEAVTWKNGEFEGRLGCDSCRVAGGSNNC